jgi:hypothetical protein
MPNRLAKARETCTVTVDAAALTAQSNATSGRLALQEGDLYGSPEWLGVILVEVGP